MKKGVEEPWTAERVAKFIDLLGYREITLKSDTEPPIIAFRYRVAEACKAEVTTEDAVKGDNESNGLIENAVVLIRGIIRTIKCHIESRTQEPLSDNSPVMPWLVEHAGCILSRCQKGRDGKTPFERPHGKKPTQEFVPFGEKVSARRVTTEPTNRMNPRYQYGIWLGMRNNSAECFIENAEGVFRAIEIRRLEPRDRWDREAINNVIGVPWRMNDGRWTVDSPEIQVDPVPMPPLPFDGARVPRERITKQDIDEFGATIGCPGCNSIKGNKRRQGHSERCRRRIEESLRKTPHGAERLERREEVINEALAEEVRRRELRKKETDRVATAAPGMTAESATAEWRENPIEPDPNPKRRMLMKSTSLTASSSSGPGKEKRTKSDADSRMQVESTSMPTINESTESSETLDANTQRRIVGKSEPVAVTTQEAIDGYREKTRRIANVEQIELGNIMELSITGQLIREARRANLSGRVSLCKANGWNMKNHSHLKIARRLREKIHPTMLVVTIRKDEDRGICSATLRELWRIVKDQIKERTVVVVVMSKHSTIWRRTKLKSVLKGDHLRFVDASGMRVITNSTHVAEQIKNDRDKCIVMDDLKIAEPRKIGGKQNLKSTVMDGVKFGKIGKCENSKTDEETCRRNEEKLCRSIMKGLTRRNCEKHAILADMEETQGQEQDVVCFDDVTGKELPWGAVRKARELELKYLRDLGVYEKVDEKEAIEK